MLFAGLILLARPLSRLLPVVAPRRLGVTGPILAT